jgi:hypothetical protein
MRKVHESSFRIRLMKGLLLLGMIGCQSLLRAQWGSFDGDGSGRVTNDTQVIDNGGGGGWGGDDGGGGGWGGGGGFGGKQKDTLPPYTRFIPPYDSLREMIFYEGVIEDMECEYCSEDSLYLRAQRYLESIYGKKEYKKFIVEAKPGQVIWLKVEIPMLIERGAYSKAPSGLLEFSMVIRFKEARYKYQFGNFAHITEPKGLAESRLKTYHEYYMKTKRGFRSTDMYLITADKEVKKTIEGLKQALKEPYKPDEDDW